jgi:hypothetical protein
MNLFIGCPVSDRSWILPKWFDHVEKACEKIEVVPQYVFVVGNEDKDLDYVTSKSRTHVKVINENKREDIRYWNHSRYSYMAMIRNELLSSVREYAPDFFLSLDSDILLHEDALLSAFDALEKHPDAWACGLKCYMSVGGIVHPSMGLWIDAEATRFYRNNSDDISTVDIIMAAKLMKPEAYNIDYKWHSNGEDLGWCQSVKAAGGKFIWDGRVCNKHVMGKKFLDGIDKRVGF